MIFFGAKPPKFTKILMLLETSITTQIKYLEIIVNISVKTLTQHAMAAKKRIPC